MNKKITFEDSMDVINQELAKRKVRWTLNGITWVSWEDIEQEIRIHLAKKWHLYDQNKPLLPWLNRIISHKTINAIRDLYGIYKKPCNSCPLSEGTSDFCRAFNSQSPDKCPVLAAWYKGKKNQHDICLPLALEHHTKEVHERQDSFLDIELALVNLDKKLKNVLKPTEYKVFYMVYIENKSEIDTQKILRKNKICVNVKNAQKKIISAAKKLLAEDEIEF